MDSFYKKAGDLTYLEFTRCQRADGSYYGTAGICRKGREVADLIKAGKSLHEVLRQGKWLGRGAFGKVIDVGDGVLVKEGLIGAEEAQALADLKAIPNIPKLIATSVKFNKDNLFDDVPKHGVLAMTHVPGEPIRKLGRKFKPEAWDATLKLLGKIQKAGYSHGDIHPGNALYDRSTKQASIIDFGEAQKTGNFKGRLQELFDFSRDAAKSPREYSGPLTQTILQRVRKFEQIKPINKYSLPESQKAIEEIWNGIDLD